ncbi:MAG: type II toxin-antitoxin system HicB family antitoxin [Halioglobus sp.]|nr:type II toxin-antitoxin system HicB family antitoxin [Halioglobus sp.]
MNYKSYSARIEYSDEDQCFIGHIAGIRDVVGFHGDSVKELKAAFEEAVEDYVATCEKLKRAPQRPYSGKVMLRILIRQFMQGPQFGRRLKEKV